jgi:hypothetical protein
LRERFPEFIDHRIQFLVRLDTCDAEICSIPMLLANRLIFRVLLPLTQASWMI